jgi:hypothetical protein
MTVRWDRRWRLQVYSTEDDRVGHRSAADALLEAAREDGLAGATVWRASEGYGRSGVLHTSRFPDAARGLPLVVEIVDAAEKVSAFLSVVADLAPGALTTIEAVQLARHHAGNPPLDDVAPRA